MRRVILGQSQGAIRRVSLLFPFLAAAMGSLPEIAKGSDSMPVPCASDYRLRELPSIHFYLDPQDTPLQRALFASPDINGWVESELVLGKLRFNHRAPGVGLPFDLLFIQVEVLDSNGDVDENLTVQFPSKEECFLLSIYPGGSTTWFDLQKAIAEKIASRSRLRIRVFVPDHT